MMESQCTLCTRRVLVRLDFFEIYGIIQTNGRLKIKKGKLKKKGGERR